MLNGHNERLIDEHNDRAWLAWHVSYLTAYAPPRSSRFPKLKALLFEGKSAPRPRQSMDEQISIARAWTAAVGARTKS